MKLLRKLLNECGLVLSGNNSIDEDEPHVLNKQPLQVIRELDNVFAQDPSRSAETVRALETACKDVDFFQHALMPCLLKTDKFSSAKDSLMRLLLCVRALQKAVVEILLDALAERAIDPAENDWVHQLLAPLQYMPFMLDAAAISARLLEVFEVAEQPWQLELLLALPNIIPDDCHERTARDLAKLLPDVANSADMQGAIVRCLNSLCLSAECRGEVRDTVLERLQLASSLRCFPTLFEFVVAGVKPQQLLEILPKCRKALDAILGSDSLPHDLKEASLLRVANLSACNQRLGAAWMQILQSLRSACDYKPVDVVLITVLHKIAIGALRKRPVEALFKRLVASRKLNCTLIAPLKCYCRLDAFAADYAESLFRLTDQSLIFTRTDVSQHLDVVLTDFAHEIHRQLMPLVTPTQRQNSVFALMTLVGRKTSVTAALIVLQRLCDDGMLTEMPAQLMGLLEHFERLDLSDIKRLFALLCQLVCGSGDDRDDNATFRDEINIVVRKQLCSINATMRKAGVVAALVLVKQLATIKSDAVTGGASPVQFSESALIDLADLPSGPIQDAAELVDFTRTSCDVPELLGLFYDQIAYLVVTGDRLEPPFLQWLYSVTTNEFQDIYVIEEVPSAQILDMDLSESMSLNSKEEIEVEVYVNIGGLTANRIDQILVLPAFFRALRILHHRQNNGDLTSIDALLGTGIILPPIENVEDMNVQQIQFICDCLFHTINWFRELCNAFVTQSNTSLRAKVICRVTTVLKLEQLLQEMLALVPNYALPDSYFHLDKSTNVSIASSVSVKPTQNKKRKVPALVNLSMASTSAEPPAKLRKPPGRKPAESSTSATTLALTKLRELDTDLIILLKYPIDYAYVSTGKSIDDVATPEGNRLSITLPIFRLVLTNFVDKMSMVFNNKHQTTLTHASSLRDTRLLVDSQKILPRLSRHLVDILKRLRELLKANDDRYDQDTMHTESACALKLSLGLALRFLCVLFGSSAFQRSKDLSALRACLASLPPQINNNAGDDNEQQQSAFKMIDAAAEEMGKWAECCMHLNAAVCLIEVLRALQVISASQPVKHVIGMTSLAFLERRWFNLRGQIDSGKECCKNLELLIKVFLSEADVKMLFALVAKVQVQVGDLTGKDNYLLVLGAIDRSSFHVLYKCICCVLKDCVQEEVKSLTNRQHLNLWRTVGLTMAGLTTIVQTNESKPCYRVFLVEAVAILKIFIDHALPLFDVMLRAHPDDIVEVLKIMQTTTRYLHKLCCYSKVQKDAVLMSAVPRFRRVLETLLYKVKASLVGNGCSDAFWAGNLRNQDVHGADIESQSTVGAAADDASERGSARASSSSMAGDSGADSDEDAELMERLGDEEEDRLPNRDADDCSAHSNASAESEVF